MKGFELFQTIQTSDITNNVLVNNRENLFATSIRKNIKVFESKESGFFLETQFISFLKYVQGLGMSANGEFLVVGEIGGSTTILERVNHQYQFLQDISIL